MRCVILALFLTNLMPSYPRRTRTFSPWNPKKNEISVLVCVDIRYYHHAQTNVTQWARPPAIDAPPQQQQPAPMLHTMQQWQWQQQHAAMSKDKAVQGQQLWINSTSSLLQVRRAACYRVIPECLRACVRWRICMTASTSSFTATWCSL